MDKHIRDGGYGDIGDISAYLILNTLQSDKAKEFREYLKKENIEQYKQFQNYEKLIKESEKEV